tara:strand:- start:21 stop:911 length:891 start_codon:yes stop_codon:yes gene_type:complete
MNTSWTVPKVRELADGERGIILAPPVKLEGRTLSSRQFNLHDLRYALLFFDRIGWATNNIIHFGTPGEIEWLRTEGVAEEIECRGSGHFDARCVIEAQKALFRKLDGDAPGVWSVGRGGEYTVFLEDDLERDRGLHMKLFNSIPVPDKDVPLQDVLEFKERRRAELIALRHHIARLYQTILSSPDRPLAEQTEFEAFQKAISDQLRVTSESGLKFRLTDLSVNLSVKDVALGWIAGSAAYPQVAPLSLLSALGVGAATTAVSAALSIGVGASVRRQRAKNSPFEYVSDYHSEVFGE